MESDSSDILRPTGQLARQIRLVEGEYKGRSLQDIWNALSINVNVLDDDEVVELRPSGAKILKKYCMK